MKKKNAEIKISMKLTIDDVGLFCFIILFQILFTSLLRGNVK